EDDESFTEVQREVLGFAREMTVDGAASESSVSALASRLGPRAVVELLLVTGHWLTICSLVSTLGLQPDLPAMASALPDTLALRGATARLQDEGRARGLWATHLPPELGGQGMGQVRLGLMHEILGSSPIAPLAFGNAAPDSGNSEILALAGTPEQKDRWLHPLLAGDLRSAFSMTEPDTAGSDPTQLRTRAVRDGDDWVIDGHKWFSSNGSIADF